MCPTGVLKSRTGLPSDEVQTMLDLLSELCSPVPATVRSKIQSGVSDTIRFGSPALDKLFDQGEGLPIGQLIEISGASASGKTCICLQLSLRVQLPRTFGGLFGSCVYISTECNLPTSRLHQMAIELFQQTDLHGGSDDPDAIDLAAQNFLSNVYPTGASTSEDLIHAIHYQLPAFIARLSHPDSSLRPVRLIVLDSIGALLRPCGMMSKASSTQRGSELNQIADGLKYLAYHHNLAVVVINQVSSVFQPIPDTDDVGLNGMRHGAVPVASPPLTNQGLYDRHNLATGGRRPQSSAKPVDTPFRSDGTTPNPVASASGSEKGSSTPPLIMYEQQARHFMGRSHVHRHEASLGLTWATAINIRIMLHRLPRSQHLLTSDDVGLLPVGASDNVREARVIFSPFGGQGNMVGTVGVRYIIDASGIVALEDHERKLKPT